MIAFAGLASCAYRPTRAVDARDISADLDKVSAHADSAAQFIDEWGTIHVSAPVIVGSDSNRFKFDLALSGKDLFEGAGVVEGSASQLFARSFRAGASVKVEPPIPVPLGEKPPKGEGDRTNADAPGNENKAAGDVGTLSAAPVASPTAGAVDQRKRLRIAASDSFEQSLHRFLSSPGDDLAGDVQIVYMPFMVSCQPGWRTRAGYVGQVEARLSYAFDNEPDEALKPKVVALYPAIESQELDLRNAFRDLAAIGASLAFAGEYVGAKAFLEAAQKTESNAQTTSSFTTVTSFSASGESFGYEFAPSFRALTNPAKTKSNSGFLLEPTSFPAVAVVAINKNHRLQVAKKHAKEQFESALANISGELAVQNREIQLTNKLNVSKAAQVLAADIIDSSTVSMPAAHRLIILKNLVDRATTLVEKAQEDKAAELFVSEIAAAAKAGKVADAPSSTEDPLVKSLVSYFQSIPESVQVRIVPTFRWRTVGTTLSVRTFGETYTFAGRTRRMSEGDWSSALDELSTAGRIIDRLESQSVIDAWNITLNDRQSTVILDYEQHALREKFAADYKQRLQISHDRIDSLEGRLGGRSIFLTLPDMFASPPPALGIVSVSPTTIASLSRPLTLFIEGPGLVKDQIVAELKDSNSNVIVDSVSDNGKTPSPPHAATIKFLGKSAIKLTIPSASLASLRPGTSGLFVTLTRSSDKAVVNSGPLSVAPTRSESLELELSREDDGIEAEIPADFFNLNSDQVKNLIDVINALQHKSQGEAKVHVDVNTNTNNKN